MRDVESLFICGRRIVLTNDAGATPERRRSGARAGRRDLIRGMGGELTAESAPGGGTTFTVTLTAGT
jgi:hypothetical protein